MPQTLCTLRFESQEWQTLSSCRSHGRAGMCSVAHIPLTSALSVIFNSNRVGSLCHPGLFHLV